MVGFLANQETLAEGIEALIFPSDDYYSSLGGMKDNLLVQDMTKAIKEINKELLPYKRISRFRILTEAMPMTSTKKIKRPVVLQYLKDRHIESIQI